MKTIEMEAALMGYLDPRQNLIVPNVSWGLCGLHECDLLALSKSGYGTEIEIKISKSDLLKDKEKSHRHNHNHIKYLFFAVPVKLKDVAMEAIPKRAGLFVVEKYVFNNGEKRTIVRQVRGAEINKTHVKWGEKDRYQLARLGTMRILGLKQKIIKLNNND